MAQQCILVTGAAGGTQGMTGKRVSEFLLHRGQRVRAFVHKQDERSEYLESLGAEVFVGDLLDFHSVRNALTGVAAVYFAYPVQAGLLEATANMAVAAHAAGVKRLVNLAMLTSAPDAPTPRMRQNYLSERIMNWADIGAVHLKAAVFYENLYGLVGASATKAAVIRLPWGDETTVVPLVSAQDVARAAVELLLAPNLPPGSSYPIVATTPSLREIVASFSRILATDIRYENISDAAWRQAALDNGLNDHAVEHLSQLWRFLRTLPTSAGPAHFRTITDTFERFVKADPLTLEDFLIKQRAA